MPYLGAGTAIGNLVLNKVEQDERDLATNPDGWGFDLWDVRDDQGRFMGQVGYMPERKKKDGTRHDDGKDWYARVEWAKPSDPPGVAHSISSFHETKEQALEAMAGFFGAGTWAGEEPAEEDQ